MMGVVIVSEAWIAALSALATGILSLIGVYVANRKSSALIGYRIEQLEKKVDVHNRVVERVFKLEGEMTEAQHDIRDLKNVKG